MNYYDPEGHKKCPIEAAKKVLKQSKSGSKPTTPGFDNWLNKGASDNKVYFGMKDGEAKYTGITRQSSNTACGELPNAPCPTVPVNTGNTTKKEGASGTQTGTETAQNTATGSMAAC